LLPIKEIGKRAGERCMYQITGGCSVYHLAGRMPRSCFFWNCRWLVDDDTDDQPRPDKSHLVIDMLPDFVALIDDKTGEQTPVEVVQVWCDPAHRNAYRAPDFRRYVRRRACEGKATIVRFSSAEAVTLFAPEISPDGKWHEIGGKVETEEAHRARGMELFRQKKGPRRGGAE
jgi:hypothetical protein